MPASPLPARLETDHYRLDRLQASDAEAVLAHFADPEVTRFLDIDPLTDIAQARGIVAWTERIAAADAGARWAIRARDGGAWVGTAGFNAIVRERASRGEIAYDLGRAWWGRGVMREVIPALLRTGFVDLDLNRLEAFVTPGNERSSRLLARHGFRQEGLLRQYGRWRGRDWDQEIWGLLRAEWQLEHGPRASG
jgi:ribosomal-protein-alanine N-acetyltransferase